MNKHLDSKLKSADSSCGRLRAPWIGCSRELMFCIA